MKLFVDWVVRNEEQFIERSLRSALPYVDRGIVIDTGSTDNTLSIVESVKKDFPNLLATISVDIGTDCNMQVARNKGLQTLFINQTGSGLWYMEVAGDEAYIEGLDRLRRYLEEVGPEIYFVWPTNRSLKKTMDGSLAYYPDEVLRPKIYRYEEGVHWFGGFGGERIKYKNNKANKFGKIDETNQYMKDGIVFFKEDSKLNSIIVEDNLYLKDVVYEHYLWIRDQRRLDERHRMYLGSQHGKPFTG